MKFKLSVWNENNVGSEIEVTIQVNNNPPIAHAGQNQNVYVGDLVTLYGTGSSDEETGIKAYEWHQTAGTSVTLSQTESEITTFIAPDVEGELEFKLTVYSEPCTPDLCPSDSDFVSVFVVGTGDCTVAIGDLNGDASFNVLDVVILSNCILSQSCGQGAGSWTGSDCGEDVNCYGCAGDMNEDIAWNVLDSVILSNCILSQSCGG